MKKLVSIAIVLMMIGLFFMKQAYDNSYNKKYSLHAIELGLAKVGLDIKPLNPDKQRRSLRSAYLKLSPSGESESNYKSLLLLIFGLRSQNQYLKETTIPYVRSLAIDMTYGKTPVDEKNIEVLKQLLIAYREVAENQIEQIRYGFPNSPTLQYLNSL